MLVGNLPQFPRGDTRIVGGREAEQSPQHPGLENAVLVEDEEERRRASRCVGIVSAAEADVDRRVLRVDARECAAGRECRKRRDARRGRRLRAVVQNQDVDDPSGGLLGEARNELLEEREIGAVGDEADVNSAHGTLASAGIF